MSIKVSYFPNLVQLLVDGNVYMLSQILFLLKEKGCASLEATLKSVTVI